MQYSIEPYCSDYRKQVIQLLSLMWGLPMDLAVNKFTYKYDNNPYDNNIYAIVALSEQQVVGFRGFVPTEWEVGDQTCWMLLVTDAYVAKAYRRQGIFKQMTLKAIEHFQDGKFICFLNLSSNPYSFPGNIQLGWTVLADKTYHRFTSLRSLVLLILGVKFKSSFDHPNIQIKDVVKERDLISDEMVNRAQIKIMNPQKHFKYKCLRNKLIEFSKVENAKHVASVWIQDKGDICTIEDFVFQHKGQFLEIVKYLKKRYRVVSVWHISIERYGIKMSVLSRCINFFERKRKAPFLIRIMKSKSSIYRLDLMRKENWDIKNILEE